MTAAYSRDETEAVNELLGQAALPPAERDLVLARATELVARVRAKAHEQSAVESFMREYDLSSEEGVLLMCVAEALLRIPDQRDRRQADLRQARRRRLGIASRQERFGVRQRLHLGPDADRQARHARRRNAAQRHRRAQAPDRPRRRAGDPPRGAPGDAHHGPPVRHGPHDQGSARARRRERQRAPTAIPTTCSARPRSRSPTPSATTEAYKDAIDALGRTQPAQRIIDESGRARPTRRASRSSCRRCIRATKSPSARACTPS